ncbi:MAG: DUF916 domain-containing protein [Acidimicrobiales bacterium]
MAIWRRVLLAATVTAVALGALAPPSWGQDPPSDPTAPQADPGAQPAEQGVVHSWALAPAGSTDASQPGNRSTLTYEAAPGAEIDDAVTLFNYSNVQLTFRLYATDAFNNDDGAFDLLTGDEQPTDVGSWITVAQETLTVPARSQVTVPISVEVPADATPGDHAGAVLASSVAQGTGAEGKVVNLDRRTGSRVYLRVDGALDPDLVVEAATTPYTPARHPVDGTAEVTYRIRNRGNVRLRGTHSVSVAGFLGLGRKRTPTEELPELLPGEDFTVTVTLAGLPATGLAFTEVHLQPASIDGDDSDLGAAGRSAIAFAPPLTLILGGLAVWLALYARRAYGRHRRDQPGLAARAT